MKLKHTPEEIKANEEAVEKPSRGRPRKTAPNPEKKPRVDKKSEEIFIPDSLKSAKSEDPSPLEKIM
jgi:hypothetical protein